MKFHTQGIPNFNVAKNKWASFCEHANMASDPGSLAYDKILLAHHPLIILWKKPQWVDLIL